VWELAKRFDAAGHEVTVVTSTRGTSPRHFRERIGNIDIIRYAERFHFFEAPLIPHIAFKSLTLEYDLMHVHGMSPTITDLGIVAGKFRKKPVVLTYHNDIESDYGGRLGDIVRLIHHKASAPIVGLSDAVVTTTLSYGMSSPALSHLRHRLIVIPVGVDPTIYGHIEPRDALVKGERVLFVGQLRAYKGIVYLLDAIAEIKSEGHPVYLDIVGTGPSMSRLKEYSKSLAIDDVVTFWGHVDEDDLNNHYAKCDLLVLPSINRREAFGIVQLEAMAAGRPVVATDIPGVREIALMGGGRLAKPEDAASLKKMILASLHADAVDHVKYRQIAEAHSWDRIANKYLDLFESLVGR